MTKEAGYERKESGVAESGATSVPLWGTSDLQKRRRRPKFPYTSHFTYQDLLFINPLLLLRLATGKGSQVIASISNYRVIAELTEPVVTCRYNEEKQRRFPQRCFFVVGMATWRFKKEEE